MNNEIVKETAEEKVETAETIQEISAVDAPETVSEEVNDASAQEEEIAAPAPDVTEELNKKGITVDRIKKVLAGEAAKAKAMIRDKEKMQKLADKAQKLCEKMANLPVVGRYFKDIPTLCQIIRDYVTGKYKEIPLATVIAVTVALLYLVNPFDLVPDTIPLLGVMDDVAAVGLMLEAARNDLESYRKWRAKQTVENK